MKERFLALDALRGVAALGVLSLHVSGGLLPHRGYLAVDVFFVLSGFVIAHAYEARLLSGMSVRRFTLLRAIRLYPLVQLGVFLSVSLSVALQILDRGNPQYFGVVEIVFAIMLLPYITAASADMYLVLSPTWSLFNELVVNVVYAAIARLLSNRVLFVCCAVSGAVLLPAILIHGSVLFGPFKGTLLMGLIRTSFSFAIGVLIYRLRSKAAFRAGPLSLAVMLGVPLAALSVPDLGPLNGVYETLAVALVIPAVVAGLAHVQLTGRSASVAALLGDLSYPVYILHWPLRNALFVTGIQTKIPAAAFLSLASLFICLCAFVALKLYDEPVRSLLMKALRGKAGPAAPHPVTAP